MSRHTEKSNKLFNNDRMNVRDMTNMQVKKFVGMNDHSKNLDRMSMERDFMFPKDSKFNNDDNVFGEITGTKFEEDTKEGKGLPLRGQYQIKKQMYDENNHFDFNLFDEKVSKINVKNYDPFADTSTGGFADVSTSMANLSEQINPTSICSTQIDRLNNNLFYYTFDLLRGKSYIINSAGLFNLFGSLYLSSGGITEIELKKFFEFPKKDALYKGLLKINKCIDTVSDMIKCKNFMILANDVPYDPEYYKSISPFCELLRVNIRDPIDQAEKINMIIAKTMGIQMKNPINPLNLEELQMMFLTTTVIHPIWNEPFDKISSGYFYVSGQKYKTNYLYGTGKSYGYFEDNEHQLIEIRCGDNLVMGVLLHKNDMISDIDDIKLHFFISHMKQSIIDEIKIPMFKQDLKMRFNSTLKNMGLKTVFMKVTSPDMFPENVVLHDVVQNVKIIIDDEFRNSKTKSEGSYQTNRKFFADKPFIYYFRLVKTNTILFIGTFQ